MTQYILECIAFQLVFLIIYDLFLKRETFFQWNRAYLLGTYILSLILPLIKIEAFRTKMPDNFTGYSEFLWNLNQQPVVLNSQIVEVQLFSIQELLYLIGAILASVWFGVKMWRLHQLRKRGNVHYFKNFTQILIPKSSVAFSFFKSIFLGEQLPKKEYEAIISHELVHIKQRHTLDLLFFELMRIVNWFNPLVYVYQSRISELHEFIADAQVPKTEREAHYDLLLSQAFQTQHISFVNQFFKSSLIKKRIVMLKKSKSKKVWQLKYVLLVPMILGMLAYTSLEQEADDTQKSQKLQTGDDAKLIEEIEEEINKKVENQGSISNVYLSDGLPKRYKSLEKLSKIEFFEYRILYKRYLNELLTVSYTMLGEKVPEEILIKFEKIPWPSTNEYSYYLDNLNESYVSESIFLEKGVIPFAAVENVPVFPGCETVDDQRDCFFKKIQSHISKNFNYPKEAEEKGIQGRVNIMFTIDEMGLITNLRMRGPDSLLTNEAERIINRIPKMQPGKHKGEIVKVAFSIPITFKLDDFAIQSGSGLNIRSMEETETSPLYLIDGEETTKEALNLVNPTDIESMNVLKNEYAVNVYGEKGKNGVVLITLKENIDAKVQYTDEDVDVPFSVVDEVPVFPGCEGVEDKKACFNEMMQKHISKNFSYPREAQEKEIQGRVNIMFTVAKNGNIKDMQFRGPDKLLEDEAQRIINQLPQMEPGKQKGKKVNVPYSIPITFKLD